MVKDTLPPVVLPEYGSDGERYGDTLPEVAARLQDAARSEVEAAVVALDGTPDRARRVVRLRKAQQMLEPGVWRAAVAPDELEQLLAITSRCNAARGILLALDLPSPASDRLRRAIALAGGAEAVRRKAIAAVNGQRALAELHAEPDEDQPRWRAA